MHIARYTKCLHDSQLVDDPQQAVPAGGAFVLQLVVVEQQQGAQHLPAADDGCYILEGGGRPGEPGHCGRKRTNKKKQNNLSGGVFIGNGHAALFVLSDPQSQVCRGGAWLGW